jgi:8-oxo-dGTP pyrophosphatase MutT (NUDIX family)
MKIPTIAKVLILNDKGELLLLRRSQTDTRRPGQWDFPGGNVDQGEDLLAAAIRETDEEAGIAIKNPKVVYAHSEPLLPDVLPTWIFFAEKVAGRPDVRLSLEHDNFKWVALADAPASFEYHIHQQTLRYLIDNKVFESL